jgi:CTP:molybdopterin cytidylyltransferase MocA
VPKLDCLILSAGLSERMKAFKPLMKYRGIPFLLNIIMKVSQVCENICVVTGFQGNELKAEIKHLLEKPLPPEWLRENNISDGSGIEALKKTRFVHNPLYQQGMFGSLQTGLKELQDTEWMLYHFVDQPHIPAKFYQSLSAQIANGYDWIQPRHKGVNGHPLVLHNRSFPAILAARQNETLKQISQRIEFRKKYWECPFPEILKDFDTKQDLNQQERRDEDI